MSGIVPDEDVRALLDIRINNHEPWHYADRHITIGLILVLALLVGTALAWIAISHEKGRKR